MDTRAKIISHQEAGQRVQGRTARWISGHFDPLLAEHVRELRNHSAPGRILVVEVTNPPTPLLPQRARAELVAALAMVDFVVLRNGRSSALPIHDSSITKHFIERVLQRHRGETSR